MSIKVRLSIMMFLQFFVWGSWYVAMYGFMNDAGMTEIGDGGSFDAAAYVARQCNRNPLFLFLWLG